MRFFQQFVKRGLIVLIFGVLASCGGGGGGGGSSQPETINGISVPAQPSNPTASLAGTDANANGVRDDAERAIAARAGSAPVIYTAAMTASARLQTGLVASATQSSAAIQNFVVTASCGNSEQVSGATAAMQTTLNNRERQEAAIKAYVDSLDSSNAAANTTASGVLLCN